MTISLIQQIEHFKTLSHEEQFAKVNGILSILEDDVIEMRGIKDTLDNFGKSISTQELTQIFESILSLVQEYQQQEEVDIILPSDSQY